MTVKLPLFRCVADGYDSYLLEPQLRDLLPRASRSWRLNGLVRSLQMDGDYMKLLDGFADHAHNMFDFMTLMEHCYERGIKRPSSYSSLFHALVKSPSIQWTYNGPFVEHFAGGWEETKLIGESTHKHFVYDINSAYLWSLTQGLPNTKSFRATKYPTPIRGDAYGFREPGLYVIDIETPLEYLPYPFNCPRPHYVASTEEIEAYELPVTKYHYGVTWDPELWSTAHMQDAIYSLPCAKQTSRSFWGRWASDAKVECYTRTKDWKIRNPVLNMVWAHLILSRVKLKIWREISHPKHIYVDSVIVEEQLATGTNPGEWRLVATYDDGISILGPGLYGPIGGKLDKAIGRKRN